MFFTTEEMWQETEVFGLLLPQLFRLRTIQQNELANSADRSNKAIVAFTIITIIFLPLNFFTSYFAMIPVLATPGPASSHTLRDFWSVSAPIGVGVLLLSMTFAFRHHVVYRFGMLFKSRKEHIERTSQQVSGLA